MTPNAGLECVRWVPLLRAGLRNGDADDLSTAIAKGVETNARARMTDDCKKGIAKFLEK